MESGDWFADIEGDVQSFIHSIGCDPYDPPTVYKACVLATKHPPLRARIRYEAEVGFVSGAPRVYVRHRVAPARARWLIGHELGEIWYQRQGYREPDLERRCDAFGACLVAPRSLTRTIVREVGTSPKRLAEAFATTRACALLRIGEVTGRPVKLCSGIERERGEPFLWGDTRRALRGKVPGIHPVYLSDEKRWGLMASTASLSF